MRDRLIRVIMIIFLATFGVGLLPEGILAQGQSGDRVEWFEETGHTLTKGFLKLFEETGGLEIHGYPITEPFSPEDKVVVQYFQNSRIQYDARKPELGIVIGPLGKELGYATPPVPPPQFPSRRRVYYPQTGHSVSFAFLTYFREHGAEKVFGYPITEMFIEDGRIVQYFENLKLEWHPEDRDNPVKVGNLGEEYLNRYRDRIPLQALNPVPDPRVETSGRPAPTPSAAVRLRAMLSLRYSVMGNNSTQIVTVLVRDSLGQGVKDASVVIRLYNAQNTLLYESRPLVTDERGLARTEIRVTGGRIGERITVKASITYGASKTETQNTFLIWW